MDSMTISCNEAEESSKVNFLAPVIMSAVPGLLYSWEKGNWGCFHWFYPAATLVSWCFVQEAPPTSSTGFSGILRGYWGKRNEWEDPLQQVVCAYG